MAVGIGVREPERAKGQVTQLAHGLVDRRRAVLYRGEQGA
jgi:hypothetical protein